MAKRKQRSKEEIEREILDFVGGLEFPTTSTEIARVVRLNWFTAKTYLEKLRGEGKLHLKKVGRQNQWWTENMSEQKKLAKKACKLEEENVKLKEKIEKLEERIAELES